MPLGIEAAVRGVHPRAIRGLFHGKRIQHGFQCVDKGKRPRTRRDWQPNVQYKFLYSEALRRKLKVCVTTHALKRIDKAGGLDMYLLTEPLASQGSIVASELRKAVKQVYKASSVPLPKKEGPTSILAIVRERLNAAGLQQSSPAAHSKFRKLPSTPPASPSRSTTAEAVPPVTGAWSPIVTPPHCDIPRRLRARRKALAVEHLLKRKGLHGEVAKVDRNRYAAARKAVLKDVRGLNRHQLLLKLPKVQRSLSERRLVASTRPRHRRALTSGKRVDQPLQQDIRREQIRLRHLVKRRNGLVATMRGTARNEVRKRLAVDPNWRGVFRFGWLQDLVNRMEDGPVKEQWTRLAERYQPNIPGSIIDGCFVPSATRHGMPRTAAAPPPILPTPSAAAVSESAAVVTDLGAADSGKPSAAEVARVTNAAALLEKQTKQLDSAVESYLKGHTPKEMGLQVDHRVRRASLRTHVDRAMAQGYPVGRKLRKMRKWLDDDWLQAHIVPRTGHTRFVLGNGMVLPSRTLEGQREVRQRRWRGAAWKSFKAAGGLDRAAAAAQHSAAS